MKEYYTYYKKFYNSYEQLIKCFILSKKQLIVGYKKNLFYCIMYYITLNTLYHTILCLLF